VRLETSELSAKARQWLRIFDQHRNEAQTGTHAEGRQKKVEAGDKGNADICLRELRVPLGKRACAGESGIREYPQREFGYAPHGEKVAGTKPDKCFGQASVIGTSCIALHLCTRSAIGV